MIIATDEALPYWESAFAGLGEIRLFNGRSLCAKEIRGADALVVRSVTNVNASLLEGSSVRFVATASAGMDNLDKDYLQRSGTHFCNSAGCNAEAVAEYVLTTLHIIAARRKWDLKNKSLAIIGVGNVGSRVERKARAHGMKVLLCDPLLRNSSGDPRFRDFDEVMSADILTFHVPLVAEGPYPTWHMIDRRALERLSSTQFLVNTSRGSVFDNVALKTVLADEKISGTVLDVWEGEPAIDYELLKLVDIGTPHIAGFGIDGKIRATEMAREELCRFFQIQSPWDTGPLLPEPVVIHPEKGSMGPEAVLSVLLQAFRVLDHDLKLRDAGSVDAKRLAEAFDTMRNRQPLRHEFRHYIVRLSGQNTVLEADFRALGFKVEVSG